MHNMLLVSSPKAYMIATFRNCVQARVSPISYQYAMNSRVYCSLNISFMYRQHMALVLYVSFQNIITLFIYSYIYLYGSYLIPYPEDMGIYIKIKLVCDLQSEIC
jgi:hypothetical protein